MEKYEIQKLRELPIEGVAEHLGLQVNAHHKALCPFHDDHHASLSFNARKNTCRCFVCMDKSLGTIDLVMRSLHVDFLVACHWLADKYCIGLTGQKPAWAYSSPGSTSGCPKTIGSCPPATSFQHSAATASGASAISSAASSAATSPPPARPRTAVLGCVT